MITRRGNCLSIIILISSCCHRKIVIIVIDYQCFCSVSSLRSYTPGTSQINYDDAPSLTTKPVFGLSTATCRQFCFYLTYSKICARNASAAFEWTVKFHWLHSIWVWDFPSWWMRLMDWRPRCCSSIWEIEQERSTLHADRQTEDVIKMFNSIVAVPEIDRCLLHDLELQPILLWTFAKSCFSYFIYLDQSQWWRSSRWMELSVP